MKLDNLHIRINIAILFEPRVYTIQRNRSFLTRTRLLHLVHLTLDSYRQNWRRFFVHISVRSKGHVSSTINNHFPGFEEPPR